MRSSRRWRLRCLVWLVLPGAAAAGILTLRDPAPSPARAGVAPVVLDYEQDGLVYVYHVPTRTEGLFDARKDPRHLRNLLARYRAKARELRRKLTERIGVPDLRVLGTSWTPVRRRLHTLGYL